MRARLVLLVVYLALAASADATPGTFLYVQPEVANVREAPSRSARVVMRLARGHKLMEVERRNGWVRVLIAQTLGREGWVHGTLVGPRKPSETSPSVERSPAGGAGAEERGRTLPTTQFELEVSGSPAIAIRVECRIVTGTGERGHIEDEALSPKSYAVEGQALSCLVQKRDARGRLEVALVNDRRLIASAETSAPFNYVRVRSNGPWGDAEGTRGAVAIPLLGQSPESKPRPTVPRLSGPTVPPLEGTTVPPLRNIH